MLPLLISSVIIFGTFYWWFSRPNQLEKNGIIHAMPHPMLGNNGPIVFKTTSFAEFLQDIYNLSKDAKYVGYFDFSECTILIRDPDLIKTIAIKSFDNFVNHAGSLTAQEPLISKNILSLKGNDWRQVRNLLTPAFTSGKMKAMFKLMSDCGETFANFLAEKAQKEPTIDPKDAFLKYTNDVIASCAFGLSIDSLKNPTNDFYVNGKKGTTFEGPKFVFTFFLIREFPKLARWLGIRLMDRKVEGFFHQLVKETIETRDREGITRPDMIQLMMETRNNKPGEGPTLSIQDMVCQAFIFFFGGFDSTATAMCFMAHCIAANPGVQRRLQAEVDEVQARCKDGLTYDAVNGMVYMEAVINETLRLYPVQMGTDRVCTEDFELPPALPGKKPVVLRAGDKIVLPIYALHRDPKYFPHPDEFRPERFLEDPKATLQSPAYMPFGIGPRMCLGNRFAMLEIKAVFYHLISKCTLTPGKDMILPLELSKETLMTAKGGFSLHLQPRN